MDLFYGPDAETSRARLARRGREISRTSRSENPSCR
jgi:hypothetical protein